MSRWYDYQQNTESTDLGECRPEEQLQVFHSLVCLVMVALLSGCAGGFNCPFNRPSCCDNVLFGCGPFDLPAGCSCNDYFLRSFNGTVLSQGNFSDSKISRASSSSSSSGTWRTRGEKKDVNSCPLLPRTASTTLLIRENTRRVSLKALGYVVLRGVRTGNTIDARGAIKIPALNCMAFIRSTLDITNPSKAPHSVTIDLRCSQPRNSCSSTYRGSAKKL